MSERNFRGPHRRGSNDGFVPGRARGPRTPVFSLAPRRQPTSGPPLRATLKWFSPDKGFGFVTLDDGSGDAFLHAAIVEQSSCDAAKLQTGTVLQVRVVQGQKGLQVTEILTAEENIAVAPNTPARGGQPSFRQEAPGRTSRVTGTVKWYSAERGFGFVAVDGGQKEVFVHATALQRSRIANLSEGQRVTLQVGEGRKGPEAVSVSLAG